MMAQTNIKTEEKSMHIIYTMIYNSRFKRTYNMRNVYLCSNYNIKFKITQNQNCIFGD
jgi:hypothetical protein